MNNVSFGCFLEIKKVVIVNNKINKGVGIINSKFVIFVIIVCLIVCKNENRLEKVVVNYFVIFFI